MKYILVEKEQIQRIRKIKNYKHSKHPLKLLMEKKKTHKTTGGKNDTGKENGIFCVIKI